MKKYQSEVALGVFILAAAGLLGYMSLTIGGLRLGRGVHVTAEFGNASGLVKDGAVMIAGVDVGRVEELTVKHDKALVKLFIRDEAKARTDVVAAIRAKSLLGEKYVELRPQSETAPLLEDGAVISKTEFPMEMDQLLSSARPLLSAIDPEDVGKLVKVAARQIEKMDPDKLDLNKVAQMMDDGAFLLSAARKTFGDPRLARNLNLLQEAGINLLVKRGDALGRMVDNGDRLMTALGPQAPHLAATMARADRMTARFEGYLPMLDKLAKTADKFGPTLDRMPAMMAKMEPVMDRLPNMILKLEPAVDRVPGLVVKIDGTVEQIQPFLKMLQEKELRKFIQKEGIKINFW